MTVQNDEELAWQAIEARDYEEAVRLLRPLAERNSGYALLTLGWIYETGATGTSDKDAARSYYEGAAAQGSASGYLYLGKLLLRDGREMDARAAFERGAQLDDDECNSELARLADNADAELARKALHEKAYEEAARLLRPLAERNSERALLALGWIYERGDIGAPDWEAARLYYQRAASLGSGAGYFELGRLLKRQGEEAQARTAFQAGAERGHLSSMSRLGRMMIEGRGGPTEVDAGTAWLEKAAASGHILAQKMLLGIEARKTKSIFQKLRLRLKNAALGLKWGREMSKDPSSDRVR